MLIYLRSLSMLKSSGNNHFPGIYVVRKHAPSIALISYYQSVHELLFPPLFLGKCHRQWSISHLKNQQKVICRVQFHNVCPFQTHTPRSWPCLPGLRACPIQLPGPWRKPPFTQGAPAQSQQWVAAVCTQIHCSIVFSMAFQMAPQFWQSPHSLTTCLGVLIVNIFFKANEWASFYFPSLALMVQS